MTSFRHKRLEHCEAAADTCDALAGGTTDGSKQAAYAHIAAHYRDIATSFRQALVMRDAAFRAMAILTPGSQLLH
jgi:HD superfamily phosphohydrolase YqeK